MHCLVCKQGITESSSWSSLFSSTTDNQFNSVICQLCSERLEPITGEQCKICSRPFSKLPPTFIKQNLCADCFTWEQQPEWQGLLTQNISIFYYNDFLKDLLALFKFRGDHELIKIFGYHLRNTFNQTFNQNNPPIIIPIPLSKERLYERGFNQATSIANLLHLPLADILTREHTEKQSKKSRIERLQKNATFKLKPDLQLDLYKHKIFLIVDDIYTTGTTIRQVAKILQPLTPKGLYSLTIARS